MALAGAAGAWATMPRVEENGNSPALAGIAACGELIEVGCLVRHLAAEVCPAGGAAGPRRPR